LNRCLLLLLLAAAPAWTAGCGKSGPVRFPVTGEVTFEGQPVTEGTVSFVSKETGTASAAALDASGRFEIPDGLPAGRYVVAVAPPPPEEVGGAPAADPPREYPNIPQKYRSDTTSDLTADVGDGAQEPFRFALTP
jgi:predicted small lipoprotein YifL